jgi:hypothetical protein
VKGSLNKVADALSRYYESDTWYDTHPPNDYVNADERLDRDNEDLPIDRIKEIESDGVATHALRVIGTLERRRSQRLLNKREQRDLDAAKLSVGMPLIEEKDSVPEASDDNPTVLESRARGSNLRKYVFDAKPSLMQAIKDGYVTDPLFSKILKAPGDHPAFLVKDGFIWTRNRQKEVVLCVPVTVVNTRTARGLILEQGHEVVGHFGAQRTADYVRRWYWWPKMGDQAAQFCESCEVCQRAKSDYGRVAGKLHSLPIPLKPWESIGMDFIGPFPESEGYNHLWVVVCRLTGMVHLIPIRTDTTAKELSWIYIRELVRLHGLPSSIVSDRDSKFTSAWWRELHRVLGAKLLMSTSFHPQTDGTVERMNRSIGQIFRSVIQPDQTDWVRKAPLVEFAINSSINESTGFAPFELMYTRMPRLMDRIDESLIENKGIRQFVEQAAQNVNDAFDSILQHRVFQKVQADKKRRAEPEINQGDRVYLATRDLALPKGRASKLLPKFIGPYLVVESHPETSTYRLDLPEDMKRRNIHSTFHVSKLRPYLLNDETLFPGRSSVMPYDYGEPDEEDVVREIDGHRWKRGKVEFHVVWEDGDREWRPIRSVEDCVALDTYLALQGVKEVKYLDKKGNLPKEK